MHVSFFTPIFFLLFTSFGSASVLQIDNLRCEYLKNPLGIDQVQPRLSWILHSNDPMQKQTAFRILVSSKQGTKERKLE
jgi:alpha-L-rhamnosidase